MKPLLSLRARLGSPVACLAQAELLAAKGNHPAAFRLLARAARRGSAEAVFGLGRCYMLGRGVPPSMPDALRWFGQAGAAGHVKAQTQLAELALQGIVLPVGAALFSNARGGGPDWDAAQRWSLLAAEAGSPQAKALLAFILTAGPADRRDEALGDALYQQSADQGWPLGLLGLGLLRLRQSRADEARQHLCDAAAHDLPTAHYWLGALLETGSGGEADLEAAGRHYRAAAEAGHAMAQMRYGFALLNGRGVARDRFAAETWLRRAALAGEVQAAAALGFLFAQEGGSYAEAASWLLRAAEGGHAAAARTLGQLHLLGHGVRLDRNEAVTWLRAAALADDLPARDDLTALALAGQLNARDAAQVVSWLRQAADDGDPSARFKLGICHADGIGVPVDPVAARGCFLKAAAQGLPDAAAAAAEMLVNGRGGQRDMTQGLALFRLAARAGHAGALYALGVLLSDQDALDQAATLGHAPARLMLEQVRPAV